MAAPILTVGAHIDSFNQNDPSSGTTPSAGEAPQTGITAVCSVFLRDDNDSGTVNLIEISMGLFEDFQVHQPGRIPLVFWRWSGDRVSRGLLLH